MLREAKIYRLWNSDRGLTPSKIKPASAIWSCQSHDPFSQTSHYKSLYFTDNYNNFQLMK